MLDNTLAKTVVEAAAMRCCSVAEVQRAVAAARQDGVPLYPYSTGRNWGYGSAGPVLPGCRRLDLSGMREILNASEISHKNPVAVVQPGVTQGQLADFLAKHHPDLTFNVTGSARETSLIGNALDRGVGYLGPRREDLYGLEVVCGTGELIYTGFRRLGKQQPSDPDSPLAHLHPYGLGPMLDGLFFQGNFGIVTSACFRLLPRPPVQVAVSLALHDAARLGEFIDALAALKRDGVMGSVTHIGNKARTRATLSYGISAYLQRHCGLRDQALVAATEQALDVVAPNEWASLGGVSGTKAQVRAAVDVVRKRMRGMARVMVVSEALLNTGFKALHPLRAWPFARAQAAAIDALRPLHGLALGRPTDVAIENLLWKYGRGDLDPIELDASNCGLIFINPALPMQGDFVQAFEAELRAEAARYGHTLYTTLNIETATSMVAVINLLFDKSKTADVERAHACAADLESLIRRRGLEVYRARTDMMGSITDPGSAYWRMVRELKQVFDPDNIIAPGRYNLA